MQPVLFDESIKITSVRGGDWHVMAVDDRGHAYSWGESKYGKLGNLQVYDSYEPQWVTSLDEERIILQDGGCLESDTSEVEEDEKDPAKKEKKAEMETELNMKMI